MLGLRKVSFFSFTNLRYLLMICPLSDETVITPSNSPSKRTSKRKSKLTSTHATSLINQEDAPVPVDGADVKDVEMEEHPEAVGAAVRDGDGCGVSGGSR